MEEYNKFVYELSDILDEFFSNKISKSIVQNNFEKFKELTNFYGLYDSHVELIFTYERVDFIRYMIVKELYDKHFPLEEYMDISKEMQQFIHDERIFTYYDHENQYYCYQCNNQKAERVEQIWDDYIGEYNSYIEWLPRETLEDVVDIIKFDRFSF